jgi:dephospho-CoA kinase
MKTIGLTGGIAAGKSTVASRWMEIEGAASALIDSDQLAHRCLEPGTSTWNEIVRVFGQEILKPDQTVDRRKLGTLVFGDEQKRATLNSIVHPAVRAMWASRIAELSTAGTVQQAVVVIPLLYEVGAENEFDAVVVTACSAQTQMLRLMERGLTDAEAKARILAQWPMPQKMDRADFVIWNDGSQAVLNRQADIVWNTIKEINHHAPSKN